MVIKILVLLTMIGTCICPPTSKPKSVVANVCEFIEKHEANVSKGREGVKVPVSKEEESDVPEQVADSVEIPMDLGTKSRLRNKCVAKKYVS